MAKQKQSPVPVLKFITQCTDIPNALAATEKATVIFNLLERSLQAGQEKEKT